jgi:hypothetical protein
MLDSTAVLRGGRGWPGSGRLPPGRCWGKAQVESEAWIKRHEAVRGGGRESPWLEVMSAPPTLVPVCYVQEFCDWCCVGRPVSKRR